MEWKNSECGNGWLHRYETAAAYPDGTIEERCCICGGVKYFHPATPNYEYLSYHVRSMLQPDDPRFDREYPDFKR